MEPAFDRFVEPLDYPMFVLTVPGAGGSRPDGCLVGFATQCSISPPRFLVCVSKANHTYRHASRARIAALHLLTAADRDLAVLFGTETGDEVDKFERCDWHAGAEQVPLLDRCPAWLAGTVDGHFDLGDHEGMLINPTHTGPGVAGPALMLSAVSRLRAGHPG